MSVKDTSLQNVLFIADVWSYLLFRTKLIITDIMGD